MCLVALPHEEIILFDVLKCKIQNATNGAMLAEKLCSWGLKARAFASLDDVATIRMFSFTGACMHVHITPYTCT